jgi:hypothetical protein
MKRFLCGVTTVLLLVAVFSLQQPGTVRAAASVSGTPAAPPPQGFNIITSPLPIKINTTPGSTVQTELRMENQGDQPENIKVGLMKFGATGNNGVPDLFNLSKSDTYASWVHFSPDEFTAQPGVWTSVKMTINIPSDAGLGYYLAVTFGRAAQSASGGQATLKGAVATLVLLNVDNGHEKRQLQLVSFTSNHGLYEYLPATFSVKIHNTGNIYDAPIGNIFIERGGKTIDTLDLNAAGGNVLPQSNRVFTVPWQDGFPYFKQRIINGKPAYTGNGDENDQLIWNFSQASKLRIGRYSAKLLVVYDNGTTDVPVEANLNFWVVPWKLLLLLLVIVALIGYGVYNLGRSVFRKTRGGVSKYRRGKR